MTEPPTTTDLSGRIIALEAGQTQHASELAEIKGSLSRIEVALNDRNKINWANIIAVVGLVVLVGGGLWGLGIKPIQQGMDTIDTRSQRLSAELSEIRTNVGQMGETFKEVETQFATAGKLINTNDQWAHLFRQLLWRRVYGEDLPSLDYWPELDKRGQMQ